MQPAPFEIDIYPRRKKNAVRLTPQRRVPVAILGTETLDVTKIDSGSLRFGPSGAEPTDDLEDPFQFFLALKDVNRDDLLDLVPKFGASETGLEPGDDAACLTGLLGHRSFRACDDVLVRREPNGQAKRKQNARDILRALYGLWF